MARQCFSYLDDKTPNSEHHSHLTVTGRTNQNEVIVTYWHSSFLMLTMSVHTFFGHFGHVSVDQTGIFESDSSDHTVFKPMTSGSQNVKKFSNWPTGTGLMNFQRLNYLNGKIDLNLFNLSYQSYKVKCKKIFLGWSEYRTREKN